MSCRIAIDPSDGKKQFIEWDSPKHIQQLKNLSWELLQLADEPFKSDNTSEISVLKSTAVEYGKNHTKIDFSDHSDQFPYPVELRCGDFVSSATIYCYFIEALAIYGKKEQAVHLAMNLALAIVRYYTAWLEVTYFLSCLEAANWGRFFVARLVLTLA